MNYNYLKKWFKEAMAQTGGRGKVLAQLFLTPPIGDNNLIVDLHSHDDRSDGRRSSRGSFQNASFNGVDVYATTNHDNIKTQTEYYSYQTDHAKYRGAYINGVEITCRLNGLPVEVLVYDYDFKKATKLINDLEFPYLNRRFKLQRIVNLCEKRINILNELKILESPLDINDFVSVEIPNENGEGVYVPFRKFGLDAKRIIFGGVNGLKEEVEIDGKKYKVNFDNFISKMFKYIAQSEKGRRYLAENGIDVIDKYVSKIDIESLSLPDVLKEPFSKFNRFLVQANDASLKVSDDEWWPTVEDVVEFAKKSGGVAIFAHAYGYPNVKVAPEKLMQMALESGVDGFECMHGFNTAEQVEKIYQFCRKRGLLITAGSDTHSFVSNQGDATEIGKIPGVGFKNNDERDFIDNITCSLYNVHFIGSGKYKDLEQQIEK